MKILFIHPTVKNVNDLYGADKILLYVLELLYKENEITVLLPAESVLCDYIKNISENIKIVINSNIPIVYSKIGLKGILKLPFELKKINKIFSKKEFDLIYCNTLAVISLLFTNWSKKKVIHIHEIIENKILNFGFSFLIKLSKAKVICVSEHVKKNLLFSKKYYVIHNGIPDIAKNSFQSEINEKKINFVLPGRYMKKKGQWFLLETLKTFDKNLLSKCNFYLYGSASPTRQNEVKELKDLIQEYDLSKFVFLCGFENDIGKIYEISDVILVPSIMADPFPTTVLEAMMFSKPIISTNHGGASEIIEESFGRLISPNNVKEFSDAILFFIENINQLNQMKINARKKFENYLTLEKFNERLQDFWKEEIEC